MSFSMVLYQNASDRNVLSKTLTQLASRSGDLRYSDDTDILHPKIVFQETYGSVTRRANYLYVSSFGGRYYYIDDWHILGNNLYQIDCSVDPLMTYSSDLANCEGIVRRQKSKWNLYINDGSFVAQQNTKFTTQRFPSGFTPTGTDFVLLTQGIGGY